MKQRRWLVPSVVASVTLTFILACGSSDDGAAAPAQAEAGADADSEPVRAPFGLDTRPANTTCLAPPRLTSPTSIKLTPVFAGLTFQAPVALLQAPGDATKWYVVEQGASGVQDAAIRVFDNSPAVTQADVHDFLVIPSAEIQTGLPANEGGLLGFAFHPDFAANGAAFLSYTVHSATSPVDMKAIVTRIKKKAGLLQLDRATEEILTAPDARQLAIDKPGILHNNAQMAFGPDRMLYVGMGDGGEPSGVKGQDLTTIFGKILRIDVGPTGPYQIPAANPFVGDPGKLGETWAFGFRNPWRFSFDRLTGELFAGDVGDDQYEEVDKVTKGGNYGWAIVEATHCNDAPTCDTTGLTPPIVEYPHASGNFAVVGGYVYRGSKIPGLQGSYLFADHVSGRIWRVAYDGTNTASMEELAVAGFQISSFGEGVDGELYVLAYGTGTIYRIDPDQAGAGTATSFPRTLSATGCVDPSRVMVAAPSMIPYDVNAPLWSDGAEKRRWMALPDGKTITVGADGDLDFPNGTVLMKEFAFGATKIETRLFIRHDDGIWAGYAYEWNDAQTDAVLLPGPKQKAVGTQEWTYPGPTECLQCHTAAAGRALGPEIGQLNGDLLYPASNRISNQLATLEHIGMFSAPIGDPSTLVRYPRLGGPEPIEARARAYVHTNCSHCHRPNGGTASSMDLRFSTPLHDAKICNVAPELGDLGVAGARILSPGDPSQSVFSLRVHAMNRSRMPPLGRSLVHTDGAQTIDDWIRSLASCP